MYLGKQDFLLQSLAPRAFQFFLGRTAEQKGKKEGGWGEGIFALLRFRLERFRFSLIKRKQKQKIFQILLKEKNGDRKKLKKCIEKISVLIHRSGAKASGNAPYYSSWFSLKKVRISSRTGSTIVRCS